MSRFKNLPLSLKLSTYFFIFALFLLALLYTLIIPKLQKNEYENKVAQIGTIVELTKSKIELAASYLGYSAKKHVEISKNDIENSLHLLKHENLKDNQNIKELVKNSLKDYDCKVSLNDKNSLEYNKWQRFRFETEVNMCPHSNSYFLYKENLLDKDVLLKCSSRMKNYAYDLEKRIKVIIKKGFDLTQSIHKGKIYLMWLNKENKESFDKPLYKLDKKDFCLSKISNISTPKTGELTKKEILDAIDKKVIAHTLNNKKALTWVSVIEDTENRVFLMVLTAYEEDFINQLDSDYLKILPISIIALLITILLAFFIIRKLFKSVEVLSNSARAICEGKMSIRSNIKGSDDIGVLGEAFDSMLNKLEENIKELDSKVDLRTKELSKSLHEKETLLKEIHHRVKNNLSLTINFVKLQKSKVKDSSTKEVLTDIENRVYTMALLHSKLYESKDLDSIDFKKYIKDLVNDIALSYDSQKRVSINYNLDETFINIEYAMPCGLIINELVTNAFKYAFIDEAGILDIRFTKKNEFYTLEIKDNKKGLPKEFNINKCKSLGLRLVNTIIKEQLEGTLDLENKSGASFKIGFKIKN